MKSTESESMSTGVEAQDAFERSALLYARQCPEKRDWLLGLVQQIRDFESGRTENFEALIRYEHWPEHIALAAALADRSLDAAIGWGSRAPQWEDLGVEDRASRVVTEVLRRHAPDKGQDRDLDTFVIQRAELFRRLMLLGAQIGLDRASVNLVREIEITTRLIFVRRRALGLEAR